MIVTSINKALFRVKDNLVFEDIVDLTSSILGNVLKSSVVDVEVAVVTGISYISSTGLSDINNLERYRFLDDHPFVSFYGLTEDEVRKLFQKDMFKSQSSKSELAKRLYNGYVCKRGRHIYNTYSFQKFLKTGKAIQHWDTTAYTSSIMN